MAEWKCHRCPHRFHARENKCPRCGNERCIRVVRVERKDRMVRTDNYEMKHADGQGK